MKEEVSFKMGYDLLFNKIFILKEEGTSISIKTKDTAQYAKQDR
jgi:hypothetical protein